MEAEPGSPERRTGPEPKKILHLLKLSVGPDSMAELQDWQKARGLAALAEGRDTSPFHVTRMVPKRLAEIAGQGSIYWVIRGTLCCRQAIRAIEPFTGSDGVGRCRLVFHPPLVPVSPRPCRPFQGWRYLSAADAPADIDASTAGDLAEMPEALRRELAGLGLL